ncbi:UPF0746 protein DDB_G0281095-like [Dendronephthya gigantea]|uniref:UPF0746 protein DDB_G0281095-like n=2 Tax=Dendronephthya gigantea TaxID=151771 RepID=UPI00106BF992|nr:UPF0746 protein DDB_G0281095-like [Dendronephthya gigantea]
MEDKKDCPNKRSSMVWSKDKDLILLKEVAALGVLTHKQRSRERGLGWQSVADNVSTLGQAVTLRGVRERYSLAAKKYCAQMAKEERATGEGGEEMTEYEKLMEELINIEDETDRQMETECAARSQRIENEREQALEMRERAMERLGETKKRVGMTSESGPPQRRRRSGDMMEWLQQRVELEKEERELKQAEKREHVEMQMNQHLELLQVVQQSQQQFSMQMKLSEQHLQQQLQMKQQQQQQHQQEFGFLQQQMLALMQQQQQQTQMLANMLKK